jgi:hypothetical protein
MLKDVTEYLEELERDKDDKPDQVREREREIYLSP